VAKPAPAVAKAPAPEDAWQKLGLYGAIGLAGIGCGAYLLKKRRGAQGAVATIDVIAQRSLGGKARVVWFAAGGHEMVVAVTPQSVRMLGQWPASARPAGMLPVAHTVGPEARPAASSAVAGILKLREKAGPAFAQLGDDVATEDVDADALWAKEILAATGAKR
jgi:flagellar biogenesis protein FliO